MPATDPDAGGERPHERSDRTPRSDGTPRRLFVALGLPAAHREEIGRRCRALARELPPARWVPAENLHLTLVFLGATAPAAVPDVVAALAAAARSVPGAGPLRLELGGGGTFPPRRPARVAWVGMAGDPRLAPLQAAVDRAGRAALALSPERRRFSAHVTVARPRRAWPRAAAERFAAAFEGRLGPPFEVPEVTLYESRLGPGGARYTALERFPLGDGGEMDR